MEANETAGTNAGAETTSTSAMDDAREKARQAASDAQQKISSELRTRVDTTKSRTADTLGSVARALSQSAQQLRTENESTTGDYVQRIENQVRRASDYLRNTNTDDMVRNAEDFARRQPAVFLGGAFVLGFLAARLVKSSQGAQSGGSIPHDRSLVPQSSMWTGDREATVSGYREPGAGGLATEADTDPNYTRQFGRETL